MNSVCGSLAKKSLTNSCKILTNGSCESVNNSSLTNSSGKSLTNNSWNSLTNSSLARNRLASTLSDSWAKSSLVGISSGSMSKRNSSVNGMAETVPAGVLLGMGNPLLGLAK
jgi:hypothetical protein